ncbi:hypothetical protein D3C72_1406650 [compost metagenome]
MSLFTADKINMGKKQVLVQPAADQRLGRAGTVQQCFPVGDLRRLGGAGLDRLVLYRRTCCQPALQGLILGIGQARDSQGHALFGMGTGIGVKFARLGAHVVAVKAQNDLFRQLGIGRQRRLVTQFEHPCHQCSLTALVVEHRVKALALPGFSAVCVIEQPGRGYSGAAIALIHRHLGGAARSTLGTAKVQLAGSIVAGVAGHAFLGEDRLDVPGI